MDTTVLGLSREEAEKKPYIASMGVYVFKKEKLLNLLRYHSSSHSGFIYSYEIFGDCTSLVFLYELVFVLHINCGESLSC